MYRPALIVALIVCTGLLAGASSVQQLSVTELINGSDLIFEGHVVELRTVGDGTSQIFTRVTFEVQDLIKGQSPGSRIELDFLGGTIGGLTLTISDMRLPKLGETGIYFVESPKRRQVHPLYGWDQGHFVLVRDKNDRTERVFSRSGSPITGFSNPARKAVQLSNGIAFGLSTADSASRAAAMALRDFKKRILEIAQRP